MFDLVGVSGIYLVKVILTAIDPASLETTERRKGKREEGISKKKKEKKGTGIKNSDFGVRTRKSVWFCL